MLDWNMFDEWWKDGSFNLFNSLLLGAVWRNTGNVPPAL